MAKKKKSKEYPHYPSKYGNSAKRPCGIGKVCTLDTEAIGLLPSLREKDPTCQHTIVLKDKDTGRTYVFFDPYELRDKKNRVWLDEWEGEQDGFLHDAAKFINELDVIIVQNWVGFDGHAMERVHPGVIKFKVGDKPRKKLRKKYPFRVMDTLVMSQLLYPDRKPPREAYSLGRGNVGPHSIEAHGMRMGRHKPENEDWSVLTDHMIHRCWEDTHIGEDFFDFLMKEWNEQKPEHSQTGLGIESAYMLELHCYWWLQQQEMRGFRLDIPFAHKMCKKLDKHRERIVSAVTPHMPYKLKKSPLKAETVDKAVERHRVSKEFSVTGTQKIQIVQAMTQAEAEKVNAKRQKKWKKKGFKGKAPWVSNKVSYTKDIITHTSSRATNWGYVTLSGNYNATTKKDYPEAVGSPDDHTDPLVAGPYTPLVWEKVGLGNRDIVRQMLYQYGWRGVNLTKSEETYVDENGSIPFPYAGKLDDDSMQAWALRCEPPEWALNLLEYYVVVHRRSQILNPDDIEYYRENGKWPKQQNGLYQCRGLVPRARCKSSGLEIQELIEKFGLTFWEDKGWDEDGEYRVPAACFAIGTNTFRCRHKYVVNIPSRGLYGKEMRQLFIAGKGMKLLGVDAAGLELRMLAHFMGDKQYTKVVLHGDIHTHNQTKAGLPKRDQAKTFIYALT